MQLVAFDGTGRLVPAQHANKATDYRCLECGGTVRLRSGRHRRTHYYHPSIPQHCQQHGKSLTHLQIQLHLQQILPEGDTGIEIAFPDVGRIADVVWYSKRLIFEVQCSPISADEVKARNRNYSSEGYRVIWILHDRYFNKKPVRAAEDFLWDQPHYFTNFTAQGEGFIYDQFSQTSKGIRFRKVGPFPIYPTSIYSLKNDPSFTQRTQSRLNSWPFAFHGDIAHSEENNLISGQIEQMHRIEKINTDIQTSKTPGNLFKLALKYSIKKYQTMLRLALERACR